MIRGGYILQPRCIESSSIAHSPPYVRELWFYLLRKANFEDKKYHGFIVKRGQLFISYKEIRDALSWKVGYRTERYNANQIKMGMKHLTKHHMITKMKQPRGVIVTICNYDTYQNPKNYEATNGQPVGNQRVPSINKNVKNVRNKNNKSLVFDKAVFGEDLIKEFRSYRTKVKAPLTQRALNGVIKNCTICSEEGFFKEPAEAMEFIMEKGWKSIDKKWLDNGNGASSEEVRWKPKSEFY